MADGAARVLSGGAVESFLAAEWDALLAESPAATSFQRGGWYRAWIAAVAPHEGVEPLLLRVPAHGPPRAAVALGRRASPDGGLALYPLSWPWADYHDGVARASDAGAAGALASALEAFAVEAGCPLVLDDVVPGGVLDQGARGRGFYRAASSPTGAIGLADAARVSAILQRPEHVRKRRRLERRGGLALRHHTERDAILRRMPRFVELHRRQWSDRADAVAPFGDGVVDGAFAAMVEWLAPGGGVVVSELLLDGEPVAMYFGFRHGGWFGGYRTCYDPALFRFSPGHLLLHGMIRDFAAARMHTLDLMRGAYAYKREYVTEFRHNLHLRFPAVGAGDAAGAGTPTPPVPC